MLTGAYHPETSGASVQCRQLIRALGDRAEFLVLTTTTDASLPAHNDISSGITGQTISSDTQKPQSAREITKEVRPAARRLRWIPWGVAAALLPLLDKTAVAAATVVPSFYTAAPIHILCSLQSCSFTGWAACCLRSRGVGWRNGVVGSVPCQRLLSADIWHRECTVPVLVGG